MCYHNSINKDQNTLGKKYKVAVSQESFYQPIYHGNGFDFPNWPVILNEGEKQLKMMYWGLVPAWAKSREDAIKIRAYNLNAKSETIFEKASFKAAIQNRRCIIPSTGFFEWKTVNKKKYPYFIFPVKADFFSMAGIWEEWTDKETGEITRTFSILTTEANPLVADIHNVKKRMPLILPDNVEATWLSKDTGIDEITRLSRPFDENLMNAYPVSKLISTKGANTNVPEVSGKATDGQESLLF